MRSIRRSTFCTAMAMVMATAALAGCGAADDDGAAADPRTGAPSPTRSRAVPAGTVDLEAVCTGKVYPDAPPFAGQRPHPMLLVGLGSVRQQWAPSDNAPDRYQLVACATRVAGAFVDTCDYRGAGGVSTQTLVRGDVEFRLVEVSSGREVARVPVAGLVSPTCQTVVTGDNPRQYGPVDQDALVLALAPYFSK